MIKKMKRFLFSAVFWTGLTAASYGVDFSGVPGVVIKYWELDYPWYASLNELDTPANRFIADPEIVILPNGWLLAAHAWGGDDGPAETRIYRSTNGGTSWTHLVTESGITTASLFVHDGIPYFVGEQSHDDGDLIIMYSTDNGVSWTRSSAFTGLTSGKSTPDNPVVFNDRIWTSGGLLANLSVSTTANLLLESSWAVGGATYYLDKSEWMTGDVTIGEAQVVASPDLGVFTLPKVKGYPYTMVVPINSTTKVGAFDPINGFASLPGGEKKFGAAYDSVSEKFIILSNPILPSDGDDSSDIATDMIRNTAALLTSKDLLHWNVEKVFLYSSFERQEGFGYLNFDFDGDDLVVVARTAARISGEKYPNDGRAHDSNCFTFHRLENFRSAVADHVVQIYDGNIRILERTPDPVDDNMILGSFALGDFPALTADAQGLGVANGGQDIYVWRSNGAVFHFDAFGNFLENLGTTAPVVITNTAVLSRRVAGECSWSLNGSGDWAEPENWFYWGRADTDDEIAVFGTAISGDETINVSSAQEWWNFATDDDQEGWRVVNASSAVSGGYLSGTADSSTTPPWIVRSDRFFYGADVHSVVIRMKADENCTVNFYWNTTHANASESQKLTAQYTGNGAYQTISFNTAGVANWDEEAITMLRIDPHVQTSSSRAYSVDWISVPKVAVRIKGMRFNHYNTDCSYTIDGSGQIGIDADSGNGSLEVVKGSHTIDTILIMKDDVDVTLANATSLKLSGGFNLYGHDLIIDTTGSGQLYIGGSVYLSGGSIVTDGNTPINIRSGISGLLNGTLEFAPASLDSSIGSTYDLFVNTPNLDGMTFSSLNLPDLPAGRQWNTDKLYTTGEISVEAEERSLTIDTRYSTTTPTEGTYNYDYGTSVSVQMDDPTIAYSLAYLYRCTGWVGTGSAPASGSSTNTGSFTITEDSTVTWLWTTNYYLSITATDGGSVSSSSGWRDSGSSVTLTAVPDDGYVFAGWSGDTSGDTNSTSMTVTMTETLYITANFEPIPEYILTVASGYGTPSPTVGTHTYTEGTSLSASVGSPVAGGTTIRYVCSGWTGSGDVPSSGSTTDTGSFTLTQDSSVIWNWGTEYKLVVIPPSGGSIDKVTDWYSDGSSVTLMATPDDGYYFSGWDGNVSGDTDSFQITLTMDQARLVIATFAELPKNPLPYIETFEGYAAGDSISVDGYTNGWYSSAGTTEAVVTNLSYEWNELLHPVEEAVHAKVLRFSDTDISVQLETNEVAADTTVDFMLCDLIPGFAPDADSIGDSQSAFFVDKNGHLNVLYGLDGTGTNDAWQVYTNTSINASQWMRLTYEFDYTTYESYGVNLFRVLLNGVALQASSNAYSRSGDYYTPDSAGEWLLTASHGEKGVKNFRLKGSGMLDDLVVTTNAVTDFYRTFILTAVAGNHGAVSPLSTNVTVGGSATFIVTADDYYRVESLNTNEILVGIFNNDSTATSFTWNNVQAAGTLAATFAEQVTAASANTPYWWLAQYGLTNFDVDASADTDGDGMLTWQEQIAGTDPTSSASVFGISNVAVAPQGTVIRWPSVSNRLYSLTRTTSLLEGFTAIPGATNITATPPENTYTNQQDDSAVFYRIGVKQASD